MHKLKSTAIAGLLALALGGCWGHSYPNTNSFIRPVEQRAAPAETVQVFTDANGTFYPAGWEGEMGRPRNWKADSLLNESNHNPHFRRMIEEGERQQIADLADFAKDKQRLFILVHGYNNRMSEAETAYRLIEERLDSRRGDGIVRFFWDGLTGTGIGGGKIWFNASGYSQLAGSRGLRRVLDTFSGKEVYLVGHSRGTSVILSALGNPVYDPDFLAATRKVSSGWGPAYSDLLRPPPLKDRGNRLHIIVMAPAVDRIDFCDASQQPETGGRYSCPVLRELGQVKSFRYTVNPGDPVLKKFVGLSGGFNPTGLGLKDETGRDLRARYPFLLPYKFEAPASFHPFIHYIGHPTFEAMLRDAGVLKTRS
jgi:hypothetical protein